MLGSRSVAAAMVPAGAAGGAGAAAAPAVGAAFASFDMVGPERSPDVMTWKDWSFLSGRGGKFLCVHGLWEVALNHTLE